MPPKPLLQGATLRHKTRRCAPQLYVERLFSQFLQANYRYRLMKYSSTIATMPTPKYSFHGVAASA